MPQQYGLHNLDRHSLFRADGTEHSYSSLPTDYPLERTVSEPACIVYDGKSDGCSTESFHVFTGTPEKLTDEEEQHEKFQALKCFSKPTSSLEKPTVGTFCVFSLTNEQKPDELCGQNVKPHQINNQQQNMLITGVGREAWDPGTLKIRTDVHVVVKWSSSEGLTQAVNFSPNMLLSVIFYVATSIPSILVSWPIYMPWDPGATTFPIWFMTAADSTKLQCIDVYKSAVIQILVVKLGARNAPIFATAIMCSIAFDLRWTEMNVVAVLVQVIPYSKDTVAKHMKARQVQWDPGIIFTLYELWWLSKGTEHALRHLLAVKFGTHNSTYLRDTAAIICDPPANLIQQRRTIAVLEFLSSVVCTWDPGIAFVHQQGIYESYNAKNLLFPRNYLQIWEMDIIFITFLPP